MTNKKVIFGIMGLVLVLTLGFSACTTDVATLKATNFEKKPIGVIGMPKYTVLGTVTLEKDWFGILGMTISTINLGILGTFPGVDNYLYQSGGVTYVDLLDAAKEQYPDVDAIIDINIDYSKTEYWVFYGRRRNIVSGLAIRYSRDVVDYPPKNEVYMPMVKTN